MKTTEIKVGTVYTNGRENRRVLLIKANDDGSTTVRYQPMPHLYNANLSRFDQMMPFPSAQEFNSKERVAPGVLLAQCTLKGFARWAQEIPVRVREFAKSKNSIASQVIDAVMRRQYTSLAIERAVFDHSLTREFYPTLGPVSLPWIYTMADGSRVAFMAPVILCEIDDFGCPILEIKHQLDFSQSYALGDMKKVLKAEEQLWMRVNRPAC